MAQEQIQSAKKTSIGGQALIEGVMMRGPQKTAMAIRHVSGRIVLEEWETDGQQRPKILRVPFIRGIFNFIDSMRYGYKCLMRSAELSGLEEEEKPAAVSDASTGDLSPLEQMEEEPPVILPEDEALSSPAEMAETEQEQQAVQEAAAAEILESPSPVVGEASSQTLKSDSQVPSPKDKREQLLWNVLMIVSMLLGVALAVFLFFWLPSFLFSLLGKAFPALGEGNVGTYRIYRGIFEGLFRILLFLGYMILVSQMKDIRRVFQYHGAEHKTIFCYEHGLELTVDNVRKQRRFHPRCGTSFMVLMLLIGVIVSIFIWVDSPWLRTGIKLLTIPLVVGIGYELIKLAGRRDNWFTRVISAPGLWIQRITTKEPDDQMIECAIAALKEVIPDDPEADNW